jgi:Family of unknown function (DUF6084)
MTVAFSVVDVAPEPFAATPILMAEVDVTADEPVHAIALRAQIRIDPVRRGYSDGEAAGLVDLFGARDRWADTQHTFLWQHAATMVPGFAGGTRARLPLECTYDFEVAAAKYLHALQGGSVPLQFLFSGTVFTSGPRGFAVQQVPWDRDDDYDMPVSVWQKLIAQHYPGTGWLRLSRDTIDDLAHYRSARGLLSFDEAITALLPAATEEIR